MPHFITSHLVTIVLIAVLLLMAMIGDPLIKLFGYGGLVLTVTLFGAEAILKGKQQ